MNSGKNTPSIDPSWKGVIKWGGLSLLVAGAIAVLFFVRSRPEMWEESKGDKGGQGTVFVPLRRLDGG